MSSGFPSAGIRKKSVSSLGSDDTLMTLSIPVPATQYGILYQLYVDCNVGSETDVENLNALVALRLTMGGTIIWGVDLHPFVAHVDAQTVVVEHRTVDLGPWLYDFGLDGLYNGVRGDDLVLTVGKFGTGIKSRISIIYSGD